jgi:diguanylate cyclase (GGDEF)-like protein
MGFTRGIGRVFDKEQGASGLADSDRIVQEALDALHIGLSVFDADLRLVACNSTFLRMLGCPPDLGAAGTPLEDFLRLSTERGDDGESALDDAVRRRLVDVRAAGPESFCQTLSDGTALQVVRRPLPSGGVVSTYTDITEVTRAREALEEKEREMTRYFEDFELQREMVEQQAQQMVHMAEDLALRNKEIEKSRAESDFQARHDDLTGLPNRRYFIDYLEQVLSVAGPVRASKAVLFVDLDNFKPVNDVLGHDHGDRLLRKVALRLTSSVRDSDFVARLGGDEFAIIAAMKPENGLTGVRTVAERILEALNLVADEAEPAVAISASIGVALYPADATTRAGLLKTADDAMYEAKSGGGNRVVFACELEKIAPGAAYEPDTSSPETSFKVSR